VTTRRPPRDILRRDRAVLVVFVVRQASSVAVLVWLTLALFQLDDHRIAWTMAVATVGFCAWVGTVVARAMRRYRAKVRRIEATR